MLKIVRLSLRTSSNEWVNNTHATAANLVFTCGNHVCLVYKGRFFRDINTRESYNMVEKAYQIDI